MEIAPRSLTLRCMMRRMLRMVTARAATIVLAEGEDQARLSTSRDASGRMHSPKLRAAKLPQFVVPTTPTTAIVKAGCAVFDPTAGRRLALFDPKTRAQAIFVHPDLVASAPDDLVTSARSIRSVWRSKG
jgi:alcohol dehydrogenase class IV